ncbi:GtrA family protein [Paenibacillus thalictri]|uniref:GtrA family protein n=1 Tax=Paenibacillus thalictri TaxID=2527873 RepID=A0A4Q9DPK3_9BACL|nr:GtrA family protein [Paenibacillus thalictri]TBL75720.1 GtrA family protein [Paenibacillus thalictri]
MKNNWLSFFKYCSIGAMNTCIDLGVFTLLTYAGWSYVAAQCVSYIFGVLNSYFMNRSWTFRHRGKIDRQQFLKFLLLNGLTFCITTGLLSLLVQAGWGTIISKLCGMSAGFMFNYMGSKLWVFEPSNQTRRSESL